jgi:hypothetical protein
MARGKIRVKFEEKGWADNRFRPEVIHSHYTYHIAPSKDYFLRTKEERKSKSQKYREYLPG